MKLVVVDEEELRRLIAESWGCIAKELRAIIKEELSQFATELNRKETPQDEPLLMRGEIARQLRITLPTLHARIKEGMPSHRQKGKRGSRVLFLKSEVLQWMKEHYDGPSASP